MKIIVAGSRTVNPESWRYDVVNLIDQMGESRQVTEIVTGACPRGPDQIAYWLRKTPTEFPANWGAYGKSAGIKRNVEMADYADMLIAIWDGKSKGTKHMITEMMKRNKPIFVWTDLDAK